MATEIWVNIGSGKASCLMAPSHYLNQYWPLISEVQRSTYFWEQFNSQCPSYYSLNHTLKIIILKLLSHLPDANELTHWGRVTHICVSKLTSIGSDNGLSPGRRQAIIWTNARIFSIGPLGTNFSENLIEIHIFFIQENAFENVVWKMASILSLPQCVKAWPLKMCSWGHCWLQSGTKVVIVGTIRQHGSMFTQI